MRMAYVAVWYDPARVEKLARAAGWNGEDGLLDAYHPDEDSRAESAKEFTTLDGAVKHLSKLVADGRDFWGQGEVREFEIEGSRCRYCTCRGWKCIRLYGVDETGIVSRDSHDECCGSDRDD